MPDGCPFGERWAQTLESYMRSTDRDLQKQVVLIQLHNIDDSITQIEASQRKFSDWRNKASPRAFSALSKAIRPLSVTPFAPALALLGAALFLV